MLQLESLEGNTLDILKSLMGINALKDFDLVGGTALALRHGHRKSVDIDLFAKVQFDNQIVLTGIREIFPDFRPTNIFNKAGLFGFVHGIKLDLVQYYKFPLIAEVEVVDGIRIVSDKDIAAMKIFAILQRARKKDMYDVSLLLDLYGMDEIINWYFKKFPDNQMLISIPTALQYFIETEDDADPISHVGETWTQIKKNISKHVNNYLK